MKAWGWWVAGMLAACLAADGGEELTYEVRRASWEQLSDRNISRAGEAALAMPVRWEHSESAHFVFHTETGFAVTQLVGVAEWSYAAIKKDLEIAEDLFERKCHIYVFLSEEKWRDFAASRHVEAWTGGWCTGRELFFQSRPHFKFQGTTLPHELTHLVIHRFVGGDVPLWLSEGLAEFEGVRLYRRYLQQRNYALRGAPDRVGRDEYLPLDELTSAIDYPKSTEAAMAFYTQSRRLVVFLVEELGGMPALIKLLKAQSNGARFDTACREVYGGLYRELEIFEKKFRDFVIQPGSAASK